MAIEELDLLKKDQDKVNVAILGEYLTNNFSWDVTFRTSLDKVKHTFLVVTNLTD